MSEFTLPEGWSVCTLADIGNIQTGNTPPKNQPDLYGDSFPIFKPGDLDAGSRVSHASEYLSEAGRAVSRFIPAGSTYVTCIGATIGKTGFVVVDGTCNQQINTITPEFGFNQKWMFYWICSPKMQNAIISNSSSTTLPILNKSKFSSLETIIPPFAEQQQIAQKLDEFLAQVDTLKTRLDAIPNILKRFRQSVLAAAVSGRLTEGDEHWVIGKVGDIVEKIEAGKNLQCIETPPQKDQYGIVKISAVTWGIYDEEESKTLPDFDLFMESRRIQEGDFLISRANTIELLGNPVIVHRVTKNLMLSDKVLRLVMRQEEKYWLSIFLRSHFGRKQIEEKSTGNQMSMRNIGQKALLDIDIPKPPFEEQTAIVRRVEQLFAYADQIEQRVKDAQARVNHLTQSILAKAFRGELTADWRAQNPELISGENSAAALLERIKAERESALKPKRKLKI